MRVRQKFGDKNHVGRTIIRLRKEKGLKQKELLAKLQVEGIDITTQSLSRLEGQERPATDSELRALAIIFDNKVDDLYNKDE